MKLLFEDFGALKHIEHIEDFIFSSSMSEVKEMLHSIIRDLSSGAKSPTIQGKVDGAPAMVIGTDPESGKFFVATKAVFNKIPKVAFSKEDVSSLYKGELADKLRLAFDMFSSVWPTGKIYQGDFMFDNSLKQRKSIDGQDYITFRPNTLLYAIPIDTPTGKKVAKAKIGMAWHTEYTGKSLSQLASEPISSKDPITRKGSPDIWSITTNIQNLSKVLFSNPERDNIYKRIENLNDVSLDIKDNDIVQMIRQYVNSEIKVGTRDLTIERFKQFILYDRHKSISSLKQDKAIKGKEEKYDRIMDTVITSNLSDIFTTHSDIVDIKMTIYRQLMKIKRFNVFIPTDNGLKVTDEEGLVVFAGDKVIKIVDRLEFSKNNFTVQKDWV